MFVLLWANVPIQWAITFVDVKAHQCRFLLSACSETLAMQLFCMSQSSDLGGGMVMTVNFSKKQKQKR